MDPNEVSIREMEVEDIPVVYHLGNRLFQGRHYTTLYRTWDAYEVTTGFNQDPELCLVAETADEKVVGFALGTTYEKEKGAWKYGYVVWLGVDPAHQGVQLGSRLYDEMEGRMRQQGVRMVLMDTAASNQGAIDFFKKMGFGKPTNQVWMSKVLRDQGPKKDKRTSPLRRRRTSPETHPTHPLWVDPASPAGAPDSHRTRPQDLGSVAPLAPRSQQRRAQSGHTHQPSGGRPHCVARSLR